MDMLANEGGLEAWSQCGLFKLLFLHAVKPTYTFIRLVLYVGFCRAAGRHLFMLIYTLLLLRMRNVINAGQGYLEVD
jgi:hypothetical protein